MLLVSSATMSDERELYWYDDATYDIGFYNYYQMTVDPSPWAFIICFSFCVTLAIVLPRYLRYFRSTHINLETEGGLSDNEINNTSILNASILFGSQEFIANDANPHDNCEDVVGNITQSYDDSYLPPISEGSQSSEKLENSKDPKASPPKKLERNRAFDYLRWTTFSLDRPTHQTKDNDEKIVNTQQATNGESGLSSDYANIEDDESTRSQREQTAVSDEVKPHGQIASKETQFEVDEGDADGQPKAEREPLQTSSRSDTTNPLNIMKNNFTRNSNPTDIMTVDTMNPLIIIKSDVEDFIRNSNPNDISWEEEFDSALQTTVYSNAKAGIRTQAKPVEPIPDNVRPWYLFYFSSAFRRKIRKCTRRDAEMEKIIGLALPYTAHTIVVDVFGLLEIGIIGRLLGTSELSAYFATEFAISFATMFFHGILASLKVLVSQAHGAKNFGLAGTYVQIGIWTHHLLSLPLILIGWNNFDNIVLRLGLDEDTAESAEHYARFVLLYEAFGIYDGALHCVMDVTGHEKYSAMSNGVRAFVSFLTVLTVSAVYEGAELWMVGAIHLIVKILFVFSNVCVIFHRQWLDEYWSEVDINSLKDWPTVKALWNASLRLSSGRVIENCEWNILFVFAAIQGPAEVAIWGLVGVLWDFADDIIIAISDASKVRCAYLLGSGLPAQAKYSSEKSLLIGVAVSIIISFSLAFLQSEIPRWLTNDYTLQRLLGDMIPLLCLAIGALSFGSVCWSILCAQGRSHLATAVTGFGSLVIALPLASLSNFCFNFNLQGLIACLIIGYATSGFLNSILLLTSNWSKISQRVRRITLRSEEK